VVRRIVSSVAGLGPAARVPVRLRAGDCTKGLRLFRSLVGAVVALWAARDLVKISCRVRDGETTQSGLDPPAVTVPVTAAARARSRGTHPARRRATVETPRLPWRPRPPACAPPPKAQMSSRQPSDRRSVRACAGGGPRSAQVVRVHSVSCGSAPGRGTLSTPRSTCCHASLGCRHASLLGGAGSSLRGRSRRP